MECPALNCSAVIEVLHINDHLVQDCAGVRFKCKKCTQRIPRANKASHECMNELVTLVNLNR